MKIFPSQVNHVVGMVHEVLERNRQSEDVLRIKTLQHREWGKRDRQFIADLFYALLRHRKFYGAILEKLQIKQPSDFLFAGVHLALQRSYTGIHPLWLEFSAEQVIEIAQEAWPTDVRFSIPTWLYQLYPHASVWSDMNQPAAFYVRVNTLKTNRENVESALQKEQIAYTAISENTIRIDQKIQLTKYSFFQQGWVEIQDWSSQHVVPFLEVIPGMNVLDACAGGGGKSLHLASVMKNQGVITATDIHQQKLYQLKQRAEKAGATIIQTSLLDETFVQQHQQAFQRILTDVPCSGTGTLRRKPEIKWKLTPERLNELIEIQRSILIKAVSMLHPEGKLVYSTCSILPDENEHQITWLLQKFPELQLEAQQRIEPTQGGDGFFMARLSFL